MSMVSSDFARSSNTHGEQRTGNSAYDVGLYERVYPTC